ncbi:MAG TPA: SAM-dependent methyltransferase [Trebonia sp.]
MTLGPGYFSGIYASSADPWGLAERWYETRKYALSVALLPREHYGSAFEPGCSIGVLSTQLAPRCDQLLACDGVPEAVTAARARTAGQPGVRVEQRVLPGQWPPGSFDLIIFSEILYYFGDDDLDRVLGLAAGALGPGGQLLAVHWRHPAPDYPRTGDAVHQALAAHPGLARLTGYRDQDFAAEVYARADGDLRSVAQTGGIV